MPEELSYSAREVHVRGATLDGDCGMKRVITQWLRKRGFQVQRSNLLNDAGLRRSRIIANLAVDIVVDVGGSLGQYGHDLRAHGYLGSLHSFEPLKSAFATLAKHAHADGQWECDNCAIADVAERRQMFVSGRITSSSLLPMMPLHREAAPDSGYVAVEEVVTVRLDDVFAHKRDSWRRIYLKVDVQGYEMNVLRGAEQTLSNVVGIEVEMSFGRLYEGGATFREVLDYLEARRFKMVSVEPVFIDHRTGHVLQINGILIRETGR